MSDQHNKTATSANKIENPPKSPYVFLSHDVRDAEIAEAFAKLLSSVTAGVLKCFRSSDKKGSQGIQYGVEWFPELMRKLQEATDVVCLLTENSANRPWILFEAGVAKGKLDTPILGLALGIPLNAANTGPFAQFQNSDDETDSIVKLVTQLVQKIPGAEPDDSVIRQQVDVFKKKLDDLLKKPKTTSAKEQKKEIEESTSVAKLFEEIKVMFNDLPERLDVQKFSMQKRRIRRIHPEFIDEMTHMRKRINPIAGFITLLSFTKDEMPWIYAVGQELVETVRRGDASEIKEAIYQFHDIVEFSFHHPISREMIERGDSPYIREMEHMLHRMAEELTLFSKKMRR